uniref:TRAF-like superfamily protein n=1 Tax=Arundo donax TaxID=35708 RepID=A0A0A9DE75_ARUDO
MIDKEILMDSSPSDDRILDDFSRQAEEMSSNADNPEEVSDISDNRDDNSEALHVDIEDCESSPVNWETDASETRATVPDSGDVQNEQAGKRTSFVDDSSSTCSSDSVPSVILNGSHTGGAWTNVRSSSNRGNHRRNKDPDARGGLAQGGANSVHNGTMGSGSNASGNSKDIRHESEDDKVLQKKQHLQRHVDVMSPSKSRMAESSFFSVSPIKKQPNLSQQPKFSLESTNTHANEVSGAVTATITAPTTTSATQLVSNKGPLSSHASQIEKSASVASRPMQASAPSKSEAQKQNSLVGSATTTQVITVSRPLSAPQVPAAKQSAPVTSTAQNVPLLSRSMSAVGRLGNEPSTNAPSYIPRSRTYRNVMMEKSSVGGSGFSHQTGSSEQGVAHLQSVFTSQPSILSSENLPRKEETSLRPGFTFGTVKPESLNQYQCREESSQQAASSNSIDHTPLSLNIRSGMEKLNLQGRSRSKQLLSEISTRFTPYQPQGLVGDEFPHLDIINDLLDEEQSDRRKALQQHQQGFVRQYSMPNDASTPDYGLFGNPYLFEQSEYFDEEPSRFYSPLGSARRGSRDHSYSHFDVPSYSNSGQFDDMVMNQWPYSRTDLSMPNFGPDTSGYSYQSQDYPSPANGASRYPPYRPANGH